MWTWLHRRWRQRCYRKALILLYKRLWLASDPTLYPTHHLRAFSLAHVQRVYDEHRARLVQCHSPIPQDCAELLDHMETVFAAYL